MAFIGNTNTTQAFTPAVDFFSGNGSTTAFTLSRPVASVAQVQVTIDNVAQNPSSAYTVSSNTLTFTSAPLSGTNNIYVYYTSPITQVIAPGQGTVNTTALGNITNIASGNSSLTLQTGSSPTTAVTVDTSQNVGIGTSSPSTKLAVVQNQNGASQVSLLNNTGGASSQALFSANDGTNYGQFGMWGSGVSASGAQQPSNAYVYGSGGISYFTGGTHRWYYSTNTEAMRIDSSGNLLVGTTSTITVGGLGSTNTFKSSTSGSSVLTLQNTNATDAKGLVINYTTDFNSAGQQVIFFYAGSTTRFNVNSNGNVTNTNNSYGAISDQKLKENIVDATPKLDNLCRVKVRNFNLIGETTKQIGVVAQELEQVFPSMIEESPDRDGEGNELGTTSKSVKYSVFVPMLVKSIQELKAINDTQAETINALTARIVALENR